MATDWTPTYKMQVSTPIGPGRVDAKMADSTKWLVTHARDWFDPTEWEKLSPGNGPTIFRQYDLDELTPHPDPFPTLNTHRGKAASWTEVVSKATETMKTKPANLKEGASRARASSDLLSKVQVGSIWKTRKNGDLYVIEKIEGPSSLLSWLGGKYTRTVQTDRIPSSYDYVADHRSKIEPTEVS